MNPWMCALFITIAGALGGVINALMTDNGFALPRKEFNIWCPGFLTNVLIGAFAAFASWSFYGSGAGVDVARANALETGSERVAISLTFSALAGAFIVGVAGAKWITGEVDKRLLKESVKQAAKKDIPEGICTEVLKLPPRQILQEVGSM